MHRSSLVSCAALALIASASWAPLPVRADEEGGPAPAPEAHRGRVVSAEAPIHVLQDGLLEVQVLLDEASTGATDAALSLLVAAPGARAPDHTHGGAELVYVLEGRAEMTFDGVAVLAGPGDAIYIPAGVSHTFSVPADSPPLRAVQVYVPGGPEQRFKNGAVKGATAPPAD